MSRFASRLRPSPKKTLILPRHEAIGVDCVLDSENLIVALRPTKVTDRAPSAHSRKAGTTPRKWQTSRARQATRRTNPHGEPPEARGSQTARLRPTAAVVVCGGVALEQGTWILHWGRSPAGHSPPFLREYRRGRGAGALGHAARILREACAACSFACFVSWDFAVHRFAATSGGRRVLPSLVWSHSSCTGIALRSHVRGDHGRPGALANTEYCVSCLALQYKLQPICRHVLKKQCLCCQ